MNWGHRVIIILAVFLAGMTTMVYISMSQTNEMVDTHYYEREMKYQQVIDGRKNLSALNDSVRIENNGSFVKLSFPRASVTRPDSGYIQFIKWSDSRKDHLVPIKSAADNIYQVPLHTLSKGWYKVRINWTNEGIVYYYEQNFNVQ